MASLETRRPWSVCVAVRVSAPGLRGDRVCGRHWADTGSLHWLLSRQQAIQGPWVTIHWHQKTPGTPETTLPYAERPPSFPSSQSDCPTGGDLHVFYSWKINTEAAIQSFIFKRCGSVCSVPVRPVPPHIDAMPYTMPPVIITLGINSVLLIPLRQHCTTIKVLLASKKNVLHTMVRQEKTNRAKQCNEKQKHRVKCDNKQAWEERWEKATGRLAQHSIGRYPSRNTTNGAWGCRIG